jgi:hypothetical protein
LRQHFLLLIQIACQDLKDDIGALYGVKGSVGDPNASLAKPLADAISIDKLTSPIFHMLCPVSAQDDLS